MIANVTEIKDKTDTWARRLHGHFADATVHTNLRQTALKRQQTDLERLGVLLAQLRGANPLETRPRSDILDDLEVLLRRMIPDPSSPVIHHGILTPEESTMLQRLVEQVQAEMEAYKPSGDK